MIENWLSRNEANIKRLVFLTILSICLIIIIYCNVSRFIYGEVYFGKYKPMYVVSASMEPTIKTHQWILGKKIDTSELQIGDIAGYSYSGDVIVHRIIQINEDGTYEFKGDNNTYQLSSDKNVTPDQIKFVITNY